MSLHFVHLFFFFANLSIATQIPFSCLTIIKRKIPICTKKFLLLIFNMYIGWDALFFCRSWGVMFVFEQKWKKRRG